MQNTVSQEQFAANRANAAGSTGPRTPDGKARSSQNARKHGFAAAAYTVPRLEDIEEIAEIREGVIDLYQPTNAQELYAVERIAITQQSMNRASRLEAGTLTICLNDVLNLRERPLMEMDPEMYGGGEPGKQQVKNYLLAEGFRRSVGASSAMHLCMRYNAQAERLYRRAVQDFERIKSLPSVSQASDPLPDRGAGPLACVFAPPDQRTGGADLLVCPLDPSEPLPAQTNPNPSEPPQTEPLTHSEPAPETTPAAAQNAPSASNGSPRTDCTCPQCLDDRGLAAETPSQEDISPTR
jgi:hypothetical protein